MNPGDTTTSTTHRRLELLQVPVSDSDHAKIFYFGRVGFVVDHDHQVSDELRCVQPTAPGSACSIAVTDPDGNGWSVQQAFQ